MLYNYLIFAHFYQAVLHFRNDSLLVAFMLFYLPSITVLATSQYIPLCRSELLEASVNRCHLSLQSSYSITHDIDESSNSLLSCTRILIIMPLLLPKYETRWPIVI